MAEIIFIDLMGLIYLFAVEEKNKFPAPLPSPRPTVTYLRGKMATV